ncbi:MAG: HlyD family type I secretion periplasmic adaptor subunit [Sulfuriferula sp.]
MLSIQESPPAKLPRTVMYVVTVLFFILLLWAVFGKLDIIASAEGRLVPETYVKIVQPAEAGIVQEILVKEGQAVKAGQVLMRMDMKLAEADQKSIQSDLILKRLQLRRVDAELAGRPLMRRAGDSSDRFNEVAAQYRDRHLAYVDALDQARAAVAKAESEAASAKEVLTKLRETTPIAKQQAEAYAGLGRQGYAPMLTVRDKQREYLEKSRDLAAQEATVASLNAATAEAKKQLDEVRSKYDSELQNERVEADGQYRKLQQEALKQQHKTGLLELRAPQAGIVKNIAAHTIGTVVSPGAVLLTLVPENEPLLAEVMIKNDDVGFVFVHQRVKVKLLAYPFEEYGMVDGEVINLEADASDPDPQQPKDATSGKPAPTQDYKAMIALNTQTLSAEGEQLKLVPGMQVIAEINQGRRTVLAYLLAPVRQTLHDMGRER